MRASRTGFYRFGDVVIGPWLQRPKISSTSSPEAVIIRMGLAKNCRTSLQTSKPFFPAALHQYHQIRPLLGNARYGEGAGGGKGLRGSCVGLGNRKSTPPGGIVLDHQYVFVCCHLSLGRCVGMNRGRLSGGLIGIAQLKSRQPLLSLGGRRCIPRPPPNPAAPGYRPLVCESKLLALFTDKFVLKGRRPAPPAVLRGLCSPSAKRR